MSSHALGQSSEKKDTAKKQKSQESSKENTPSKEKNTAEEYVVTTGYVHQWITLPTISVTDLQANEISLKAQKGYITVVFFIASWCLPCQNLVRPFLKIKERYEGLNVKFYIVFSHDLGEDSKTFAKEYHIDQAVIANHELLKAYHNPQLPSVYLADEDGWIAFRKLDASESDIKELDQLLTLIAR